jgi:hydroxyethylthiazole kinase
LFEKIVFNVKDKKPLVHNITNYVTVNDCANILLACGGSPIMADDENEAAEITALADALVINIGTLNKRTVASMFKAGMKANELGHHVILDPVGAGASKFRTETAFLLLEKINFAVIRGNVSEIKTIARGSGATKGVDAAIADQITTENLSESVRFAQNLSEKTGAVIVMTGATDIVASPEKAYVIHNGHPSMAEISGTGCMLSAVIGAYAAANPSDLLDAAATAVCAIGLCGELAYERTKKEGRGTASLKINLIDYMSTLTPEQLKEGAKIECI